MIGVCALLSRMGLASMTFAVSSLLFAKSIARAGGVTIPKRLAVYYGYPSLINGSNGDVEKAASTFSKYDVVILGDGIEFPDKESGRYPPGDPLEHQKALRIIQAIGVRSPGTRVYGYICLG